MKKYKILNIAGVASAIGLAGLPAFLTLAPMVSQGTAHAETTETLGTSAKVNSTLGLSTNSINLVINPSSNGAVFKTGKAVATVSTNNETGYTLYLSDSDADNSLRHKSLEDKAITSVVSPLTGDNMLANTWGYTLGNSETESENEVDNETNLALTYSPIPTVRTTIKKTDEAVSTESTTVTFGVKVNTAIPSGVYSDQVSITAIPNYNTVAYENVPLWLNSEGVQITTMQEMTHDICASVPTPMAWTGDINTGKANADVPEIELTDVRDGNKYIVRKLADGNCWMSENLQLSKEIATYPGIDDMTDGVLESTYTDINSDLPLANRTLPESQTETTGLWPYPGNAAWNSSNMAANYRIFKDPDSTGPNTGAYYQNGLTKKTGTVPENQEVYRQGNFYNYWVATLNSVGDTGEASSSICPKGWTLPANGDLPIKDVDHEDKTKYNPSPSTTGIDLTDKNSYSYTNLVRLYRMAYVSTWDENLGTNSAAHSEASKRLRTAPLSYPLSGDYIVESGVGNYGAIGYWWSSTAINDVSARHLRLGVDHVTPQYNLRRGTGFSVRCVAR